MMRRLAVPALLALLGAARGQDRAPLLPGAADQLVPGLSVTFEAGGAADARSVRMAALYVPEGTPPTPFLPPGPFKATFEAFIAVDLATDCTFSAQGTGALAVTVNEKPAFEARGADFSAAEGKPVMLRKGKNRLVARYESPAQGDAFVRLFWVSADFPREPVGPLVTSHDAEAKLLSGRRLLRQGRELFGTRRCVKCHAADVKGMPELEMDAPSLEALGDRLRIDWAEQWIRGPRALRPEATMPHLPVSAQDAADLAAYLLPSRNVEAAPVAREVAAAGGVLFAEMRCVGCHTLPEKDPAPDRIPLRHVAAKWVPSKLREFLKAPEAHYAWIEMPNFGLSDDEAAKLAGFLLSRKGQDVAPSGLKGDAARGKARFEALGCLACHKGPGANALKAPALAAIPADGWTRGCLSPSPGAAPDFGFTEAQRAAIRAFAASGPGSLAREAAPEFAERQIAALRCQACHKRDDRHDFASDLAGETKPLLPPKKEDPEFAEAPPAELVIPSLSWTGEKLKPEWAAAFLKGEVRERTRPYLGVLRMPSFRSRAETLARGLALGHGCPPASPAEPAPDPALSEAGRKLSGPDGGFDCLSCHGIGPKAATKVFEGPGPNFKYARARLRKEYFFRWVLSPLRIEPGTKMPQFFQDGRTQLTEVLDGDASRQIEALWQYLLEGEKIRPPTE
jgi:mono/diheme cytochrome c family protein